MTNKEAMEIVLKLAELGDTIAQVEGLGGERLTDKEFFTEEETTALNEQLTAEGVDPSMRGREILTIGERDERERYKYQGNRDSDERHHIHYDNEVWLRTRVPKGLSSRRTSLVTDPPDGLIPPLTPEPYPSTLSRPWPVFPSTSRGSNIVCVRNK